MICGCHHKNKEKGFRGPSEWLRATNYSSAKRYYKPEHWQKNKVC